MGLYFNPPNNDKEQWLEENNEGEFKPSDFLFDSVADDEFLVVVANNVKFLACGIAVDENDYERFSTLDDKRSKRYFIVKRDKLKPYCDAKEWDKYVNGIFDD